MNEGRDESVEDIAQALAAGRPPRAHGPYRILIGNEALEFRAVSIANADPSGREIALTAGGFQPDGCIVYQMLMDGQLDELRPDERTDLRTKGVERFVLFHSDRSFRLLIDDRTFDWGATHITGAALKQLSGARVNGHDVWQVIAEGQDRLISDRDFVDLSMPGVERFITKPISVRIVVNARPREVHKREVAYWDVVRLAFPEATPAENTVYTITYARGPHENPEGSMVDGQMVKVKEGMTFYVTVTDKS